MASSSSAAAARCLALGIFCATLRRSSAASGSMKIMAKIGEQRHRKRKKGRVGVEKREQYYHPIGV